MERKPLGLLYRVNVTHKPGSRCEAVFVHPRTLNYLYFSDSDDNDDRGGRVSFDAQLYKYRTKRWIPDHSDLGLSFSFSSGF